MGVAVAAVDVPASINFAGDCILHAATVRMWHCASTQVTRMADLIRRMFYASHFVFSFPFARGSGPPYIKYELSEELDEDESDVDRNAYARSLRLCLRLYLRSCFL